MKYKMHRNEAQKFLQKLINEGKWDEFRSAEIEYIPLDFSAYPAIKQRTRDWINSLFNEESEDREGRYMLRGHAMQALKEMELLNLRWGEYSGYYSRWAFNDDEMLIYTFCEGDTTLQMFSTREEYEAEKESTEAWYREEAS